MKITALRLFNVRRFAARGVAIEGIGDGVNVLSAQNEFGKSTSFEALHALFFQPYSSTAGDVRSLRPYSGGNPLVEADIATAQGRYRITKQFYGGRSAKVTDLTTGRLVAQSDEAEAFIAELVRGGTAGPAGLLWVRQGITGIERRSKAEEEGEKQVRASLLESVQGEVEAITGGRRMADIMAAVDEALGALVTPTLKPRAGGRYAAAMEDCTRLQVEERQLAEEVTRLRAALDSRASATKRLVELDSPDERDERRRAIAAAQTALDAARAAVHTLRAAEAELGLLRERHDNARAQAQAYKVQLAKDADLRTRIAEAEHAYSEACGRRDLVTASVAAARTEDEEAEARERELRSLLARLDSALKARDAAERLADLQRRLEEAELCRTEIEAMEAELTRLRIPDASVAELERLDHELAGLRAVTEAARPSVTMAYEGDAGTILLDGKPLRDGERHAYDLQAQVTIPGVGVMTLRSGRAASGDDRLARSEERRRSLLETLGVPDLGAARERQLEMRRREGDLRERRASLSALAPQGLPTLREEIARRRAAAGEACEPDGDPAQVRASHLAAETRHLAARQALKTLEPQQARAAEAAVASGTALAILRSELSQVEALLGPADRRDEKERHLDLSVATLADEMGRQLALVEDLRRKAADPSMAEASLRRLTSVADGAEAEIAGLRERIAGLAAEIRTRSDDAVEERWAESVDSLDAARRRITWFEREVAVLQRLRQSLDAARSRARETYLQPVMSELRPLLQLLFDDVSITFDEKTLLPHSILRNGLEEEVERLSGGMREQISVLTRLAFARLLARDGRPAPVILDDALVYSDDDRIEKMFDALHRQARDQQIIVFTCRQRAFQKLGGNVLGMTDWSPQ